MSTSKFNLKNKDYLGDPQKKRFYNEAFFSEAASHYDIATKGLSLCRDASWKKALLNHLPDPHYSKALDLACGTGDVTFLLAEKFQDAQVMGVDLSQAMLSCAQRKSLHSNTQFIKSAMETLPFPDASFDLVTGSYALRNAGSLQEAIYEVARVLKPEGTAAFLEFSKKESWMMQKIQYFILKTWGSFWGLLLHGNMEIHGYIADSLVHFPTTKTLDEMFLQSGLQKQKEIRFFFGTLRASFYKKKTLYSPESITSGS